MRILLVVHAFPPHSTGGTETYAHAQARALRSRGHQVRVLTREANPARSEYSVREEQADGLEIVRVNNTFRSIRSFAESYANPAIDDVAAHAIDAFQPEIAHVHHLTCLSTGIVEVLRSRGVPVVATLHDYWFLCHRGQLLNTRYEVCDGPGAEGCKSCLGLAGGVGAAGFAAARVVKAIETHLPEEPARWVRQAATTAASLVTGEGASVDEARARAAHMRSVLAQVTHFLAPAEAIAERFARGYIPPDRISLWPLGHDDGPYRAVRRSEPRLTKTPLRLGFLGALMVSKAPHLVVDAIRDLPAGAATVDVFGSYAPYHGDDSYRPAVERLSRVPGVTLHGSIPHERVPAALASMDVLVVPSIWPESVPLVVREAFLAGVPVIGSRIGGIPEAIKDGVNGLLFEPGDVGGLRAALKRLVASPDLLDALHRGARESVVRSLDDDVEATERLYRSLTIRDRPRLAVVVLHFGNPDQTRIAVSRLLASRRPIDDLIVVDNDPAHRCDDILADLRDRLVYLASATNLGFSGGVNLGLRDALARGADRFFVMNNDVVVPPDAIERLERALDSNQRVGVAGPVVLSRRDPGVVESAGMSFDPSTGRMRHPEYGRRIEDVRSLPAGAEARRASSAKVGAGREVRVVDGISGCAMLLARRAVESVGLFDESYFFSFEDLDWCLRARRAGFTSVIAPEALVHHEGSASMGDSPERLYYAARNHLTLARSLNGDGSLWRIVRTPAIAVFNLIHAVGATGGTLPARVSAVVKGLLDSRRARSGGRD